MSDVATQFQPSPSHRPTPPIAPAVQAPSLESPRLRVWPGVVIVALMWIAIFGPNLIPDLQGTRLQVNAMLLGGIAGSACVGLWWLFLSRAHWTDRLLILLFFGTSVAAMSGAAHPSFKYMNYGLIIRGLPLLTTSLVIWLFISPRLAWPIRRLGILVAMLLACAYCCLLRLDGVYGDFQTQISWRLTPTEEDLYTAELAQRKVAKATANEKTLELQPGDWPSFRGPDRDSRLNGVRIATDWKNHPPRKLWSQSIGPGWSSFAVVGDRIFTQEQRKTSEVVACYDAKTGDPYWTHTDAGRFEEVAGGIGPRATPTFADGKLYSLGANGKLNCLDPLTGNLKWSRDIVEDSGATIPRWGFSSSPLVVQGIVTVFAGGPDGKSVLGYHASSGELAWSAGDGTDSYCSPHLEHIDGVDQVAIATEKGLISFDPAGGKVLWRHDWSLGGQGARVAQPVPVGDSDLLVGTPMVGARRVHVSHNGDSWGQDLVWQTKDIRPYFNDLVVYKNHAYGFDGNLFTCVNLEDGTGKWRQRGFGNGQVVLLADQGLLLISGEKGEVGLVEANPEKYNELGRFRALDAKKGKTWNHPVVAHGKLFIRNDAEMACYQLAVEGEKRTSSSDK
jgi:outer membrane protein assembly factor BamB